MCLAAAMLNEWVLAVTTWVCCRNDGPKEEAVSEEKISSKLAHSFHEGHKAIHDQPRRKEACHERRCDHFKSQKTDQMK